MKVLSLYTSGPRGGLGGLAALLRVEGSEERQFPVAEVGVHQHGQDSRLRYAEPTERKPNKASGALAADSLVDW